MKSQIVLILFCLSGLYGSAKSLRYDIGKANAPVENVQTTITGQVLDQEGFPIPEATVIIKGTSTGVITNLEGKFSIKVKKGDILVFSYLGFLTQEIKVESHTTINVVLKENSQALENVVVMGYGVQQKKLITGATVQVSGADIEKLNTVDVLGALQSQSPGVNITPNSGMPGEGYKVNIRGLGTTGNSTPLYVIDGVAGGDIQNLNQSDIESVDILKDAASAAIYGARAANGVILITTKQGKAGKPKLSYDGYYGIQNVYKMLKPLNAKEYMAIQNEVNFNEGSPAFDYATRLPVIYQQIMDGSFNGTNWMDEIRNKNAMVYSHAVNMTGGTDVSTYSLGFSYTSQDGILGKQANPNFERYTARINSDYVILKVKDFDAIKIGENLTFTHKLKSGIGIDDIYWNDVRNMLTTSPLMPVYNKNGEFYELADKQADRWDIEGTTYNPIAAMVYQRGMNRDKSYSLSANAYIEIQPIKNLKFRSSYSYKKEDGMYRQYVPAFQLSSSNTKSNDQVDQSSWNGFGWTLDNTLSYIFKIKDVHNFDVVLGQSMEKTGIGESVGGSNSNSLFPGSFDYAYINNTTNTEGNMKSVSGSHWNEGSLASFFGRINYNIKETYMLSLIMRVDGSSNFARGNRWGYFPSISAGWVMSNEKFMESTKEFLDFFKIRASWGQNGNCNIGAFQYSPQINLYAPYGFGLDKDKYYTGAYLKQLANSNIKWETSEQTNIGFDSRFLGTRFGIAFDWYSKKTVDWLVQAPGLDIWGTEAPMINGGDVKNQGVEISLDWNDRIQDFNYGLQLNLTSNKNKVISIDNEEGIINGPANVLIDGTPEIFRAQVGYPIGYFWGYKTSGIFQNAEQLQNTPVKLNGAKVGDVIFVDHDNNGVIDEGDKTMIGNPSPKFTLGFNANLGWKGLDLAISTYGAFGHQIARSIRAFNTQDIFQRWHGEGSTNKYPRLTSTSHPNWNYFSDIHIENADYFKIQNITLGYDFKKLMPKCPLGQARLYITAQNLFTFTKYSGMDPEIGYSAGTTWGKGVDLGYYPAARVYMVGVNLKF